MRIRKVDDVFELDSYQLVVLAFNEFLIFTMLSNVVFNMFGAAAPRVPGCDDVMYNATSPFQQCEEVRFSTTSQMIGIMIGSAVAGQLSDLYGRKKLTDSEIESVVHGAIEADAKSRAKAKKYSFIHLYIHPKITIQTVVASISMFSVSYVTYGLLFNYDVLTGSIYMNAAVSGFLRYVVGAVVAVLDHFGGRHVGRKQMHFITVSFIMCCMFGIFFIYFNDMEMEYKSWIRALTLLAFGTTGCLFLQLLLITAEMFPTGIRNIASAHINVCGRLGNVFGPMVFSYKLGFSGSGYLILGIICLLDVIIFHIFIPETKNQPLPQGMPTKKKQRTDPEAQKTLMTISEEPETEK
ncbi:hypothetical protein CAEBREN_10522 [Caenorhabditis brenneri]|uniref:Major facilitator superfamily (MFS) profile domain-containing protein n=1 Tax=Caenorhabditis brenneri TaxID=135651 RepID=G0P6J4_CAEBE|nr:hypothetical protein CAEBREN_10522 [Caenorhabditis brenneri]